MKITLDLPSATVDQIVKQHQKAGRADIQDPADREIAVRGEDRRAIEAVFQTTITDGTDLVRRIRVLASVQIGNIAHVFSPEDLARLDMQATFHGKTRDQFITDMVREIVWTMLERI